MAYNNKFQISNLTQLELGTGESQVTSYAISDFFIAEHEGSTYSISPYDIAKDVLSNHLAFKSGRSKAKGHNQLCAFYTYEQNGSTVSSLLASIQLQDGVLSGVEFDNETHILSLYFNSTDPEQSMITVDLCSLVDVYTVESPLCADSNKFGVDLSALSSNLSLSSYALSDSLSAYATKEEISRGFEVEEGETSLRIFPQKHYCWNNPVPMPDNSIQVLVGDTDEYPASSANEWQIAISVASGHPTVRLYLDNGEFTSGGNELTAEISSLTHFCMQRIAPGYVHCDIKKYEIQQVIA